MTPRSSRASLVVLGMLVSCLSWIMLAPARASWVPTGLGPADLSTFASHAINNTVVIVPINKGMLHLADNLLCSLQLTSFDVKQIIFWTLDEGAQTILDGRGFATYRDPSLFATSKNENFRGDTKAYKRMMKERPKFFINVLTAGFDMLMLDADTVWWASPLSVVPAPEERGQVDVVFSTDAREHYDERNAFRDAWRRGNFVPPVCNGIFWMKSSAATVAIWAEMLDCFMTPGPAGWWCRSFSQDDQRGMDVKLNDGRARVVGPLPDGITAEMLPKYRDDERAIKVRLLDQISVANGHLMVNRRTSFERRLAALRAQGGDRVAAHFNWPTTQLSKEEGARQLGIYFLDDEGRCRSPTP